MAAATLSGNRLRLTVHTHRASVQQTAKLVAALLRVAGVTAGLAESNGSLPLGLWFTSPAGWLPKIGISSGTLSSAIKYRLHSNHESAWYTKRVCHVAAWQRRHLANDNKTTDCTHTRDPALQRVRHASSKMGKARLVYFSQKYSAIIRLSRVEINGQHVAMINVTSFYLQKDGCYYVILNSSAASARQQRHLANDSKATAALWNKTCTTSPPCFLQNR